MLVSRTLVLVPLLTLMAACSPKAPAPPVSEAAETPAAPAAPVEPNAFRFTIGSFPAYALRDGGLIVPNDGKTLAVNKTPEDVAKLLGEAGQPTTELSLSIQPLLVRAGERVLLFDTGAAKAMGPSAGHLSAALQEAGIEASAVTDIFISHAHGDHVGGLLGDDEALAFPNAAIHMTTAEWAWLREAKELAPFAKSIASKVKTFRPGSELVPGVVRAVEVKGHTPGHSAYLIGAGADTLLYIGDSMHHFVVSVQEPDWTIAYDTDATTAQKSRKDLLAKSSASGQRIYGVHFPYPGIGKFEKQGERIVWVPET